MKRKRHLFSELMQGIEEIKAHQQAKITLKSYQVKLAPLPKIAAQSIRDTREKLNLSRSVFALRLRVSSRTLEKWEQGKTCPNGQATALILMIQKFPEVLDKLAEI